MQAYMNVEASVEPTIGTSTQATTVGARVCCLGSIVSDFYPTASSARPVYVLIVYHRDIRSTTYFGTDCGTDTTHC